MQPLFSVGRNTHHIIRLHSNLRTKPSFPGIYMKLIAYGGTTTSDTQPPQAYPLGYIWNRHHMMLQPPQAHSHLRHIFRDIYETDSIWCYNHFRHTTTSGIYMKPTAYDGTTTLGTQPPQEYPQGYIYIWNRQHMMVQPPQAHNHLRDIYETNSIWWYNHLRHTTTSGISSGIYMKPTAYDGTTTSGTQSPQGYIWNQQHMMVQPP